MNNKCLTLGQYELKVPIVQGGMGIGISRSNLAAAVSNAGGLGVISGVNIGYDEPDFETNTLEANLRSLKKHIKLAKEKAVGKIIGVNLMVAMRHYEDHAKAAIEAGVDIIISGAGLPLALPKYVKQTKTMFAPIVSSAKGASVLLKNYDKKHEMVPDMIVIEGPKAGGHLGFKVEDLDAREHQLDALISEVKLAIKPYEEKYNQSIPVIVGGGIFTADDVKHYQALGADGLQIATRFIATPECDAHDKFKQEIINCQADDIIIVKSPVGMPGRAIKNKFSENYETKKEEIKKCYRCLIPCQPKETPYCISLALLNAVRGQTDDALLFCGANAHRVNKMQTVAEVIKDLMNNECK